MGRAMETGSGATGSGLIDADLECVGCGYNLRTLARDANCPECAAPVGDSVDAFPPAFLFRRWSSIRWIRLGLLLWVLSILAWAGGFIYCTMRVAWATELWIAARWSYNAAIQGNVSWLIELAGLFCLCRGVMIESRRAWRIAVIIAIGVYLPGSLFHAVGLFIGFTVGYAISGGIVNVMVPFLVFGRLAALASICLVLVLATSHRAPVIRIALCLLILKLCAPIVGAVYELIWALITIDPDFYIYRWVWSEYERPAFAFISAATAIAILIVDRGLRTPRKTQEKSRAALDRYSSIDRSTVLN
ncbi:hypothetical protein B7486_13170 [cyanobacterium TDX16]|nr:hypothetical protein B7486_13170 [cyanobacterium TDX16]